MRERWSIWGVPYKLETTAIMYDGAGWEDNFFAYNMTQHTKRNGGKVPVGGGPGLAGGNVLYGNGRVEWVPAENPKWYNYWTGQQFINSQIHDGF
jgi:hypothetical protein